MIRNQFVLAGLLLVLANLFVLIYSQFPAAQQAQLVNGVAQQAAAAVDESPSFTNMFLKAGYVGISFFALFNFSFLILLRATMEDIDNSLAAAGTIPDNLAGGGGGSGA